MKRWHVTLGLALLALGGIALAGTVPVVGTAGLVAVTILRAEPVVAPPVEVVPVVVAPPIDPDPMAELVEEILPPALPQLPRAPRPPVVREIHVQPASPAHPGIPELQEPSIAPRPRPVPVVLPPDPPEWDGCPACGMG